MPFGELRYGREAPLQGAPPHPSPAPRGAGGALGGERRQGWGCAPRGHCWLGPELAVLSHFPASTPAVSARRARPAMAAAALLPRPRRRPRPLLLTALLLGPLLRAGPVRTDSKVREALGPGRESARSRAQGCCGWGCGPRRGPGEARGGPERADRTSGLEKPLGPGTRR